MKSLITNNWKTILLIYICLLSTVSLAQEKYISIDINLSDSDNLNQIINSQIKEQYEFSGMASYLNQVHFYIVDENIHDLKLNNTYTLKSNQWLAVSGRTKVLLIKSTGADIFVNQENSHLKISNPPSKYQSIIMDKANLKQFSEIMDQLRYQHLWKPFAILSRLFESALINIKSITSLSWGLVILIFAIILKLALLPVTILTAKSQQIVSKINSQLQPKLQEIKKKYDGEIAHNKIMKAHKDLGVSPFYTLKPMLSFLVQIPVLIAIFNTLGEMPQLLEQSFLWVDDLSKPDMFIHLGFNLPLLGPYLNLMPIVMTVITITATILHVDKHASLNVNKKQRAKLYLMSLSFLIIFFTFPAGMVMYWAMANLLVFVQQKLAT